MADQHPAAEVLSPLTAAGVFYRMVKHSALDRQIESPSDVAAALGYDLGRISKTLLLRAADSHSYCMIVLPVGLRADLTLVAAMMQTKRCRMATPAELAASLGYPPGGVSPLAPKGVSVFLDERLRQQPTVLVGAGIRGVEIELTPSDLATASGGSWYSLALSEDQAVTDWSLRDSSSASRR